jgi:hypothetical protein
MSHSGVYIDGKEVPMMGKSCLGFDMFIKQNLKPDSVITYVNMEIDPESLKKRMEQLLREVKPK